MEFYQYIMYIDCDTRVFMWSQ